MFTIWSISLLAVVYLAILFAVAGWADKRKVLPFKGLTYGLSLGVYCTSWAFFGTTAQAANNGWWLAPTYAGTILLFIFGWQIYCRIAHICRQQKLTSMADFIATRYGQSSSLSGLISLISVIAIVPYISLQLSATAQSINLLTAQTASQNPQVWADSTFYITLLLALFAILFGARRLKPSEHNPGLIASIAFESVVKLLAFIVVGLYVCFALFDSPMDLFNKATELNIDKQVVATQSPTYVYVAHTVLGVLATLCLPRQFHMSFIENNNNKELATARWLFPIYLLLINLFILPIAYAGLIYFQGSDVGYDTFVLALPMSADNPFIALLAFLGGFSAATSMVIVSAIVLSVMITNDFINQFILRRSQLNSGSRGLNKNNLLHARKIVIVLILLLSYFTHRILGETNTLANVGLMSFTLVAQFAPAMVIGLWWRQASCKGAQLGILSGFIIWGYTLLLPSLAGGLGSDNGWLINGPWQIAWLAPTDLFSLELESISQALLLSLGANCLVYFLVPLFSQATLAERLQSNKFITQATDSRVNAALQPLSYNDLSALLQRFAEKEASQILVNDYFPIDKSKWKQPANVELELLIEREMSAVIGGASARLILDVAKNEQRQPLEQVAEFVDEATQVLKFNRDLLQSTIENIQQGISVVDSELRLVAWNQGYKQMFAYPEDALFIGRPVADMIRFNAERGLFSTDDIDTEVDKRLAYIKQGSAYKYQRSHSDGRVFEMQGNPLPGGGFVTTYTDISEFVKQQKALTQANVSLEEKVAARTTALTQANHELSQAKQVAEQATVSKTRFFAAASHDLLQPFNAASLFCSLMNEKAQDTELKDLALNIKNSLSSAEELLSSILELTKLDSGAFKVQVSEFLASSLIEPLRNDYAALAKEKGLGFVIETCDVRLITDKALLRRVLRNLLSNAIRYTEQGEVRLKMQQQDGHVSFIVEDTGIGIATADQQKIYQEFKQLGAKHNAEGLGLGLAITKRICDLLTIPLVMGSELGKGTQFTLTLPCKENYNKSTTQPHEHNQETELGRLRIWLIDNDSNVLEALKQLLENWGCAIATATNLTELEQLKVAHDLPQLLIVDYQLDDGVTGLDVIEQAGLETLPAIVNTANHDEGIRERVLDAGYPLLYKPLKAPALKRMIKRLT
ncbi:MULTISPECIES: PAS-domain containing protein [unclassified Pseudoalteromonas]|uniref:PAS domain-containing hybrid sensor histidine kinase/response regulator n=1 Tax=unclassified Pseudoalteromonas TaxID=194690 RepID=UPI000C06B6F6|nr:MULTISPECIES: PAS-domain containing protein [unclassified Pseudoalteromonas]MDP2633508.1 PAS-domain containing protein [Pseudoalteromonas sp. 1_MG-2023]PHN90470.1 hybrid sensor histidine kinase/response regulator [Pseudoalteromonas sp. 3D05]